MLQKKNVLFPIILLLLTSNPASAQPPYRQWQLMFNMSGNIGIISKRSCDMGDYLLYEYEFHEPIFPKGDLPPTGLKPAVIDSFIQPKGSAYSYWVSNGHLGGPFSTDSLLEAYRMYDDRLEELLLRSPDSIRQDNGYKQFVQIYTPDKSFFKKVYCYYDVRLMDAPFSILPELDKRHGSKLYKVECIFDMRMPGEEMDSRSVMEISQPPIKDTKKLNALAAWVKKELAKRKASGG
jgi:hypothetical protein